MTHHTFYALSRQLGLVLIFALLIVGCDRSDSQNTTSAEATAPTPSNASDEPGQGDQPDQEHEEHEAHEAHLGATMYEITRRFSALWFAGQAGNTAMVDYQVHELEEVIAEVEAAAPKESGVDVAARLNSDILPGLEEIEKAVEAGDTKAFEVSYKKVMNNCTQCHHDTDHGYIVPKIPEYNPYPNLEMSVRK